MANSTVYPFGPGGELPSGIAVVNDLTTGGVDKALSAEMGKYIGEILDGTPQQTESTWGSWALSNVSPYRAFAIAGSKTVLGGVITFKLSSYSTYKIAVTIQDGTGWSSTSISDTGWKQEDVTKQIASGEEGYNIRVSVGRVDNTSISLSEFLSVISELTYEFTAGGRGLIQRVEMLDVIPDYIVTGEDPVDLDSLTAQNEIMIKGGVWGAKNIGAHKAIAVNPGEKYVISGDGQGFWALLSNSYSAPVTDGGAVPFATGCQNRVLQKGAVAITIPEGAAYLVVTSVNGSGAASAWNIWKVDSYRRRTPEYARMRVVHWNIGGFVYTDWHVGDPTHVIPAADAETYAQRYRALIDSVGADIFVVAEYNPSFSAASLVTKDVIFQCFRSVYEGAKSGASCNTVFANITEFVGAEEVPFTVRQENRYYTHVTARLMGENVHIVEAHLDHTYNEKRVAQIAQLISDMSPYRYVIIGGDFNTGDEETVETEFSAFTDAGYTMLNSDYLGLVVTSLTEEYVDNIVVKGFTMKERKTSEASGTLSDHLLLSCDLTMQF